MRSLRLGDKFHLKVSDFGMARAVGEDGSFKEEDVRRVKLPIAWTAPEALSTGRFSAKTEVVRQSQQPLFLNC